MTSTLLWDSATNTLVQASYQASLSMSRIHSETKLLLQIHWFSIFNSFMMVIFLTGLVAMILLRTLRNDYAKYTRDDDDIESLEHDISEESGWKLVHGDVFRPPPNLALLAALLGTGVQLALLVLFVILITIAGTLISTVQLM